MILDSQEYDLWFDPPMQDVERLQLLLRPYPHDDMATYLVITRVNNPANDSPECVEPSRTEGISARVFKRSPCQAEPLDTVDRER